MSSVLAAALAACSVLLWPQARRWRVVIPRRGRLAILRRGRRAGGSGANSGASMPEVLDLLALALRGGADLQSAAHHVAGVVGGGTGRELRAVTAALAWGLDEDAAWEQAPVHWAPARRALGLAATAGVPPAQLLSDAAADLRRDALAQVEVATARLAVHLVLPLGLAFLPAFILTTVVPVILALAAGVAGSV